MDSSCTCSNNDDGIHIHKHNDNFEALNCVLIFDNASEMDNTSYQLLLKVYSECNRICIITIIEEDDKGNAIFPTLGKPKSRKSGEYGTLAFN